MIDLHVLVGDGAHDRHPEAGRWRNAALASARRAIARSPTPVTLHQVPADYGCAGMARGRARGYACGTAPWVTYMDDDDIVLPDAFERLAPALATPVDAVFSLEYVLQNDQVLGIMKLGHHLPLYRREAIADFPFADWPALVDVALHQYARRRLAITDVHVATYMHRVYSGSHGRMLRRTLTPTERNRLTAYLEGLAA